MKAIVGRPSMNNGAFVISLDFELAWGVFDTLGSDGSYRQNLIGARDAIPRILELFVEYGVSATWATVGFLFATSREELHHFAPPLELRPKYIDKRLDPYRLSIGNGEVDDPLHYAPSLIMDIAATPRQEIGSHTFSHYTALEPGQTFESFDADLRSAVAIGKARGLSLQSLVMPRHQTRSDYFAAYKRNGLVVHRGNEPNWLNKPRAGRSDRNPVVRGLRLLDSYVNITTSSTIDWRDVSQTDGLLNVPESRFLRPWSSRLSVAEPARVQRIIRGMAAAARTGEIFHLWWHPHNFGVNLSENLRNLKNILIAFDALRNQHGFQSYSMQDVATRSRETRPISAA